MCKIVVSSQAESDYVREAQLFQVEVDSGFIATVGSCMKDAFITERSAQLAIDAFVGKDPVSKKRNCKRTFDTIDDNTYNVGRSDFSATLIKLAEAAVSMK